LPETIAEWHWSQPELWLFHARPSKRWRGTSASNRKQEVDSEQRRLLSVGRLAFLPRADVRSVGLSGFFGTMSKIAPGSVLCTIFSLMLTDLLPLPLDDAFALIS
jgi:hypothetical protein